MNARDGGPAFPRIDGLEPHDHGCTLVESTDGMSLRDWFAGQALAGMMSSGTALANPSDKVATWAYEFADAMLAERHR